MDEVTNETMERMENDMAEQVSTNYGLGHSVLFSDTTNFYTCLTTKNHKESSTT